MYPKPFLLPFARALISPPCACTCKGEQGAFSGLALQQSQTSALEEEKHCIPGRNGHFWSSFPGRQTCWKDHSPTPTNCSCFFPLVVAQGGEHCPLQCSSVLREHVKPSGSSCFFFHCDLFPFLLNLGQACSLFNLQTYSLHGAGTALQGNKNTSERENSSHQSNSWSGNSDQIACKGKTQSREMQARLWPRKGFKKLCSWRCILRHREST